MKIEQKGRLDYSRFDKLDTNMLEALLRADFDAPEAEQMEEEAVLYILDLLEERSKTDTSLPRPDVEAARSEFFREYVPLLEHKDLLLDFYNVDDKDKPATDKRHILFFSAFRRLPRPLRALASVAAVLVIMFTGTATAYAFGYDPFAVLARWSSEVLWFSNAPVTAELQDEMRKYFKPEEIDEVLPKWLPAGYEFSKVASAKTPDQIEINAVYRKNPDEEALSISYVYTDNELKTRYEKDIAETTVYMANGIEHTIVHNNGYKTIAWQNKKMECFIIGDISLDEAYNIIDSIYKE